jgi:PAS domain-containing protein
LIGAADFLVRRLGFAAPGDLAALDAVSPAIASSLVIGGAALWLQQCSSLPWARAAGRVAAVAVLAIALASLGHPGIRRGIPFALALAAVGMLASDLPWRRTVGLSTWFAFVSASVALTVVLRRLIEFQLNSGGLTSRLSTLATVPATLGVLAMSAGLALSQPELYFFRVFLGKRSTHQRARHLLLVILLAPPVFEFLRLAIVRQSRLNFASGIAVTVAFEMAFLLLLTMLVARTGDEQDQNLEQAEVTRDRVMAQAALLQQEVARRTRELEMANSNLRVVAQVNSLLALTTQHTPNGVVITDAQGTVLWINPVWERLSGWDQSKSLGHAAHRMLGAVWGEAAFTRAQAILRAGQPDMF